MATSQGSYPPVGDDQQQQQYYNNNAADGYDQHTQSKSYTDRLDEKARKWQQLQNKRYGEKRKFGK
jgi:pre-mRNA-processing factor 8